MTKRKRKRVTIEVVQDVTVPADDLIVVGGPVNYFADNLSAQCRDCGVTIYFRPTAPAAAGHVCISCWQAKYAGERMIASEESIREFALYFAHTKGKQ